MAANGSPASAASPAASPAVPDAVQRALAAAASKEGFSKPRFEVQPFSGALYRATIRDEDAAGRAAELSVVVKARDGGVDEELAAEARVYGEVLPALREAGRLREPLPWPRSVHSSAECLVLADLRPAGYSAARRREALDADHCRLALAALARLHAAGLALQRQRPDALKAIQAVGQAATTVPGARVVEAVAVRERFAADGEALRRLGRLFDVHAEDAAALMGTEPHETRTLVHGHCHAGNLLFQYDKYTGVVADCRLLDFRAARLGNPACDVAALLLAGTERAERERHLPALLRDYHRDLQAALRLAGVRRPDDVYSWEQLQAQWRRAVPFGLCAAPSVLAALGADGRGCAVLLELQAALGAVGLQDEQRDADPPRPAADALAVLATPYAALRLADLAQDVAAWGLLPDDGDLDQRLAAARAAAAGK